MTREIAWRKKEKKKESKRERERERERERKKERKKERKRERKKEMTQPFNSHTHTHILALMKMRRDQATFFLVNIFFFFFPLSSWCHIQLKQSVFLIPLSA